MNFHSPRQTARRPHREPTAHDFRGALTAALIALAMRDPDPVERAAKLEILKKDGWL